jgi:hypothetical protein
VSPCPRTEYPIPLGSPEGDFLTKGDSAKVHFLGKGCLLEASLRATELGSCEVCPLTAELGVSEPCLTAELGVLEVCFSDKVAPVKSAFPSNTNLLKSEVPSGKTVPLKS